MTTNNDQARPLDGNLKGPPSVDEVRKYSEKHYQLWTNRTLWILRKTQTLEKINRDTEVFSSGQFVWFYILWFLGFGGCVVAQGTRDVSVSMVSTKKSAFRKDIPRALLFCHFRGFNFHRSYHQCLDSSPPEEKRSTPLATRS